MNEVPSDIRLFEYIKYSLTNHDEFLRKIDGAIMELLVGRYDRLYEVASDVFGRYRSESNPVARMVTKDTFLEAVRAAEASEGIPPVEEAVSFAEFVLPAIVEGSGENAVMSSVNAWLWLLTISD